MDELMTTAEVAKALRLKPNTLAVWRCNKKGPPFTRIGRNIRYDPKDIVAWRLLQAKGAKRS